MFKPLLNNSFPYLFLNKNLSEYCRNSTNEFIRKITEKYQTKKYIPNIKINYNNKEDNNENGKNDFNLYVFLVVLSISSISFYFYKRIK